MTTNETIRTISYSDGGTLFFGRGAQLMHENHEFFFGNVENVSIGIVPQNQKRKLTWKERLER